MGNEPKPDDEQLKRFQDAARNLGTDESEEAFDRALRKVASARPAPKPKRKAAKKTADR
jgi:hypothetical protein